MITCNRCGNVCPADAATCQRCGALLPGKGEQGFGPRRGTQDQTRLPAWLESLRASDRPIARDPLEFNPTPDAGEGAVPGWMRPEGEDAKNTPPPHLQGTLRPSSFSAPHTDEGSMPKRGLAASSLIDEQSLPAWMRQDVAPIPTPPKNIPASSLIQPDAVPEWMRTLQQPTSTPDQPAQTTTPMSSPPPGFSASDLIDQQSLPSWMKQQDESSAVPPAKGQTFSASSLLDMDALPSWMREYDPERGTPVQGMAQGQAHYGDVAPQHPQWQQQVPSAPSTPQPPFPTPSQVQRSPTNPAAVNNNPPGSLSAASLIERDALPDWLRADANPRQAPQAGPPDAPQGSFSNAPQVGSRPGTYSAPRAAENVRVPSRPRGEMGPAESSEVAATAFASMLGVASTAPHFPQQPQGMPGEQRPPQEGMRPGMSPMQYGMQGPMQSMPPAGAPAGSQGYAYPPGYPGSAQANAPMGMPPAMMPPQNQPTMPPAPTGEQKSSGKPAKRNLFEAIRNWLFRQS